MRNPYNITKQEIEEANRNTKSAASAAAYMGIKVSTYRKYALFHGLYVTNQPGFGIARLRQDRTPLAEILSGMHPNYPTSYLRHRLISNGIKQATCETCKKSTWDLPNECQRPIPLELNHINGNRNDHRLSNLEIICRNCHAFTPTFGSKNKRQKQMTATDSIDPEIAKIVRQAKLKKQQEEELARMTKRGINPPNKQMRIKNRKYQVICFVCHKCILTHNRNQTYCSQDCFKLSLRKALRPTKEMLEIMIKNQSVSSIGKQYGVTGAAVKKWAKQYQLDLIQAKFSNCGNNKRKTAANRSKQVQESAETVNQL